MIKFCTQCGQPTQLEIPEMDDRLRAVCQSCKFIHYENPKVVVGTLTFYKDKVLLCQRAIEPQKGLWTLPAGYMENGETTLDGAKRETLEEAGAPVKNATIYRVFDIPYIDQVYIFYLAESIEGEFLAGIESLDAGFFKEDEVPWGSLAFPVMRDVLKEFFEDRKTGRYPVRVGLPQSSLASFKR